MRPTAPAGMKAWALAAAAAVLLMAGTVHAQIDGPCIQTVRGCDGCFEDDPTRCATCAIKSGFIEVADWTANKCDCEEGLQLVGDTCQPVTPPNPGPDPSQPNQPDQPGSRYAKARACPRRFPNCRACDKNLRRCVEWCAGTSGSAGC